MEETTGLTPLEQRREEKVLIHREKLQRLQAHPAHELLQQPTKNRLKRNSTNHMAKQLGKWQREILPQVGKDVEPLQDAEDWNTATNDTTFISNVPGV